MKPIDKTIFLQNNYNSDSSEQTIERYIQEMELAKTKLRQLITSASKAKNIIEEKYNRNLLEVKRWQQKSELALSKGDENLAKEATLHQNYHQKKAIQLKIQLELDNNSAVIADRKRKLVTLGVKLADYKLLRAKYRTTKAKEQLQNTIEEINTSSLMSEFKSIEDKVLHLAAESQSAIELSKEILEQQFTFTENSSFVDRKLTAIDV